MDDRAWRLAVLCVVLIATSGAATLQLALGISPGRAWGAAALFLVACLPCAVILGAAAASLRRALPGWLHAAGTLALAAGIAAAVLQVRSGGGDEHLEPDRQGVYLSR